MNANIKRALRDLERKRKIGKGRITAEILNERIQEVQDYLKYLDEHPEEGILTDEDKLVLVEEFSKLTGKTTEELLGTW